MRLRKYNFALHHSYLLLIPTLAYSMNLDCTDIRDNKQSFDVSALGKPISVMTSQDHFPSPTKMTNTTFTVDICQPLRKAKGIPTEEDCPNGSRVCGIVTLINTISNVSVFEGAIAIAGHYILDHGVGLDPQITRLKTSPSASDREKEGFRLELHGLKYPGNNGLKQKAVIEFLCQDQAENKGSEERDLSPITAKRKAVEEDVVMEADDDEEDHSATGEVADDGHGGTLTYKSYDVVDETKVLSLEWKTKYACENSKGNDSESKNSNHWGFFTWLIIIVFLTTAAYLIFGSWLNYNRYSARGWDL
ncbi:MAG: hypothetical protein Q9196_003077, partial [Gyalolechia fulgens]